ncbi:MAG: FkbM family methyltransferase [Deltaproteobacteria bacterium]|nr:FkbM family methyltransferase [Deltaproteobacteria bacterium]
MNRKHKLKIGFKTKILNSLRNIFKISVLEKLLVKYTMSRDFRSLIVRLAPNNYQYRPNSIRNVVRNGIVYTLDISDWMEWQLYYGIKDIALGNAIALCKRGYTVFDVGTNIGIMLLNFAKAVGSEGFVYGFEPNPVVYDKCIENIGLNNFSNIKVSNMGLGNQDGEFTLTTPSPLNKGGAYINLNGMKDDLVNSSYNVAVTTIDKFVQTHAVPKIDLIKIDVEGFEYNVLKGAFHILQRHKPLLFVEVDDNFLKRQDSSAKELVELLHGLGYVVRKADTHTIVKPDYNFLDCHFDIVCRVEIEQNK